jgi:hypothetical protein
MISDLHSLGFDLMEGKYQLSDILYEQLQNSIRSIYGDEGLDWVEWFIFENDYGDKKTKVNAAQESFNKFRDVNLLRKTKELSSQGKIPIVLAGESHVGLVDNMMKNEWMGSDPIMMEALTQSQRAARRWTFAKNKKLINIKKQRTHIRKKTYSVLSKRAHKLAYLYVRKEWTQRLFGMTPYAELSLPNKQRVSQVVQKKKRKILKLAKFRFLPALKQKEADRFKGVHQYPSNLTFDTSTNEMSMSQLKGVEKYAEKQLSPQDIEFTNTRNNAFYIHFKIIDVEDEETQDRTLAPLLINDETINYGHNKGNHIPTLRDRPIK